MEHQWSDIAITTNIVIHVAAFKGEQEMLRDGKKDQWFIYFLVHLFII